MAYPIRYARTTDGVNIAFCELGEGAPLIYLPALPWSNFSAGFANPLMSLHPQALAVRMRMILYDARGCGLSDRGASDLSLDGFIRDVDAVADAAGESRFALYGSIDASRVMIHYAALRPERVTRLILWLPSVTAARFRDDIGLRAVTSLASRDWALYISTLSHAVIGGWDAERAEYAAGYADIMRQSIGQMEFVHFLDAMRAHDVAEDLARVQAPTLVLGREDAVSYTVPIVSEVAAGIANARLVVLPGNWMLPCTDDDTSREIIDFMTDGADVGAAPDPPANNGEAPELHNGASALSPREREVLALLSLGKTNAEIAQRLVVAPATASRHVHNILQKLGMNRRAEAAVYAARAGLVPEGTVR